MSVTVVAAAMPTAHWDFMGLLQLAVLIAWTPMLFVVPAAAVLQ
jgi:hypothetical protein